MVNTGFYSETYNASTFKTFCSERKSLSSDQLSWGNKRYNRLEISAKATE